MLHPTDTSSLGSSNSAGPKVSINASPACNNAGLIVVYSAPPASCHATNTVTKVCAWGWVKCSYVIDFEGYHSEVQEIRRICCRYKRCNWLLCYGILTPLKDIGDPQQQVEWVSVNEETNGDSATILSTKLHEWLQQGLYQHLFAVSNSLAGVLGVSNKPTPYCFRCTTTCPTNSVATSTTAPSCLVSFPLISESKQVLVEQLKQR